MADGRPQSQALEIRQSRVKLAVDFLPIGVGVLIMPFVVLMTESLWRQIFAVTLWLLLAWLAVAFLRDLWRPPLLRLTVTGFRVVPSDRTETPWGEVANFKVGMRDFGGRQWFRPILFDYTNRASVGIRSSDGLTQRLFGPSTTGVLRGGWDYSPDDVVETLEAWREKYS